MDLERLFFLREEYDLTQDNVGLIVGTKKFSISNWEHSKEIIPLDKLNRYSNHFNVSMDYILKLSNDKNAPVIKFDELDKVIIGKNIKYIREVYNLTQRELAAILNTTHSVIWSYETGKRLILTAFAFQLCKKYNLSLDWLCGKSDIMYR